MNTLKISPCSAVVARLFAEEDASRARLEEYTRDLPASVRAAAMGNEDYREFYGSLKDFHLAVSRETAGLIYMLARSTRAKVIIEFGTSFGVSSLHLAAALRDNGGGRLIGTEFESTKVNGARANISAAGLDDLVEIRAGDALETLARDFRDDRPCASRWSERAVLESTRAARATSSGRCPDSGRQRGLEPRIPCSCP